MRLRLVRIGDHPTLTYAMEELAKYLHQMDKRFPVDEFVAKHYDEVVSDACECVALGVGLGVECSGEDHVRISIHTD